MEREASRSDASTLADYRFRGSRALVLLHEREMRSFLDTWWKADAAQVALPVTENTDYASRIHLLHHVLRSARVYMLWIAEQLGLPDPDIEDAPNDGNVYEWAEAYLEHMLERWRAPLRDVPEERCVATYVAEWGDAYSIVTMLEHAVMHPMRHRFQLEELLQAQASD